MKKNSLKISVIALFLFLGNAFYAQSNDGFSQKEKEYLAVIKTTPSDCDANYNLGALYHNKGVDILLALGKDDMNVESLLKAQAESDKWLDKSKKYLSVAEKCKTKK